MTFDQFKKRYGAPRITAKLKYAGIPCNVNTVAKLMAECGLKAKNGKNYKYFSSANTFNHVSDNFLARYFATNHPDEKWVSDIT